MKSSAFVANHGSVPLKIQGNVAARGALDKSGAALKNRNAAVLLRDASSLAVAGRAGTQKLRELRVGAGGEKGAREWDARM